MSRIYSSVKDNITGKWRGRNNVELETLYSDLSLLNVIITGSRGSSKDLVGEGK